MIIKGILSLRQQNSAHYYNQTRNAIIYQLDEMLKVCDELDLPTFYLDNIRASLLENIPVLTFKSIFDNEQN